MSEPTKREMLHPDGSDEEISAFIKSEVESQRAVLATEIAAEIESKLRIEFELRVADQVRGLMRATTSRANTDFSPAIAIQTPRSTGWEKPPRYSGVEIGEPGAAWIRAMDEHLRLLRQYDTLMTESMVISIVISFTDHAARDFAVHMRDELGEKATWADLRSEFLERFGVTKSPSQLLRELREVKQGKSSVAVYANLFESRLSYLLAAGSADSLTAMNYFMEGLSVELNAVLYRSFFVMSENPLDAGVKMNPREAVRTIARLARRCEEIELALAPRTPVAAVRASVTRPVEEAVEPRAAVARTNAKGGRFSQQSRPAPRDQSFTREDLINHLSRKHNVPRPIVEQRLSDNLCVRCMSGEHTAGICNKPVVKTVTAAGAPVAQPTNEKAH